MRDARRGGAVDVVVVVVYAVGEVGVTRVEVEIVLDASLLFTA